MIAIGRPDCEDQLHEQLIGDPEAAAAADRGAPAGAAVAGKDSFRQDS